jgi:glycosyltransferase involved in cell wall biosynthesis
MSCEATRKPVVLILIGALWPGNDASGPNISIAALATALRDEFEFLAVSLDRPFGAAAPSAASGKWFAWRGGRIRYCAARTLGAAGLAKLLREIPYDLLLLNGFHDRHFTIPALLLRKLGLAPRRATILSPRGEFSGGALGLKAGRKAAYQAAARGLRLLSDVWLHATNEDEAADFMRGFPYARRIVIAPNVRTPLEALAHQSVPAGPLRIVFLGRVAPVKNLDFALRALACVTAPVSFDIYGPVQDAGYWAECERLIAALPAGASARHCGEIANDRTPELFARADLLFLPSRSENFGHAIFEALSCGTPVLIGDATPWRDLEADSAGWDLPLGDPAIFAKRIDALASMDQGTRARLRAGARAKVEVFVRASDAVRRTKAMLLAALADRNAAAG